VLKQRGYQTSELFSCLDKTGTLTANRIHLEASYPVGIEEKQLRRLLGDYAASITAGNQTTDAIREACWGEKRAIAAEVPFSSVRKWSGITLEVTNRGSVLSSGSQTRGSPSDISNQQPRWATYILGAPEILSPVAPLSEEICQQIQKLTEQGLRVLLFAYSPDILTWYGNREKPEFPSELVPLGVISFNDELRPEARETVSWLCQGRN
jgi:cation-transporting ATPase E